MRGLILILLLAGVLISFGCSSNMAKRHYYQKHMLDRSDRNDRLLKSMGSSPSKAKKKKKYKY